MNQYKNLVKEFLSEYAFAFRKKKKLTQDDISEHLRVTSRSYGSLERGRYCFSAITLLFLLLMLNDEEVKAFLDGFRKRVYLMEHNEIA